MARKEEPVFSSLREIIARYFPSYARAQRDSLVEEDFSQIGLDLAGQLAERFKQDLKQGLTVTKRPKHS